MVPGLFSFVLMFADFDVLILSDWIFIEAAKKKPVKKMRGKNKALDHSNELVPS